MEIETLKGGEKWWKFRFGWCIRVFESMNKAAMMTLRPKNGWVAFGLGIDRLAMILFGITDCAFASNDRGSPGHRGMTQDSFSGGASASRAVSAPSPEKSVSRFDSLAMRRARQRGRVRSQT